MVFKFHRDDNRPSTLDVQDGTVHRNLKVAFTDHLLISFAVTLDRPKPKQMLVERIKLQSLKEESKRTAFSSSVDGQLFRILTRLRSSDPYTQQFIDDIDMDLQSIFITAAKQHLGTYKLAGNQQNIPKSPTVMALRDRVIRYSLEAEDWPVQHRMDRLKEALSNLKSAIDQETQDKRDLLFIRIETDDAFTRQRSLRQVSKTRSKQCQQLGSDDKSLLKAKEHFERMFTNNYNCNDDEATPNQVDQPLTNNHLANADEIFNIATTGLALFQAPNGKAAGLSGVPFELLKAPCMTSTVFAHFFRIIFNSNLTPSSWKMARIIPIHKKDNPALIENYRPISLLEHSRKWYEKCLLYYIQSIDIQLTTAQGGFRRCRSTLDQALALHETIRDIVHRQQTQAHVAYLDIKAAYDSVPRDLLWKKCQQKGIPENLIDALKALFDHQNSIITINGKDSTKLSHQAGVQQGALLSPLLYSIFIDDLATQLESNGPSIQFENGQRVNCLLYADDVALIASSEQDLQSLLNIADRHSLSNRYRFSVNKCATTSQGALSLYGSRLPNIQSFKYLGIPMDSNGIQSELLVKELCRNGRAALADLQWGSLNWKGVDFKTRVNLYRTNIRPTIEYGLAIINATTSQIQALQKIQNQALRIICGLNNSTSISLLHELTGLPTMETRYTILKSQYANRVSALSDTQPLMLQKVLNNTIHQRHSTANYLFSNNKLNDFITEQMESLSDEQLRTISQNKLKVAFMKQEALSRQSDLSSKYNGCLKLSTDSCKIATFLIWDEQLTADPTNLRKYRLRRKAHRLICQWIAKQIPSSRTNKCDNCGHERCGASHVYECANMNESINNSINERFNGADVNERYKVEAILSHMSSVKKDPEKEQCLMQLAMIIKAASQTCCRSFLKTVELE